MRTPLVALAPLLFVVTAPALAQAPTASAWSVVEALRAEHMELSIHETRGGRRSSGGRSRSYSGRPWSSDDWAQTYRGPKRSRGRNSTYDPVPPASNETVGAGEPLPSPSSGMNGPAAPTPEPQPAKPVQTKQALKPQRTAEPKVQRLPDCPPGTTLARTNGQDHCAALPETQVRTRESVTSDWAVGGVQSQQSLTFADVLSKLQASGSCPKVGRKLSGGVIS